VKFINLLQNTGLQSLEVTAFVSSKWIPQMGDNAELMKKISLIPGVNRMVLVPNLRGFQDGLSVGVDHISVFTAASETFSKKNTNCTIDQSFERLSEVCAKATALNIPVRGYISCVIGCPYEGSIPVEKVVQVAKRLWDLGCYQLSLGDTIGVGTPASTFALITELKKHFPVSVLAGHFHDTYGQALSNILTCLQLGVSTFDSSVSGLGGCPYAKGASGNVATEDVLYMLEGLGIETGVSMDKLLEASTFISGILGRQVGSKAALAILNKREEKKT